MAAVTNHHKLGGVKHLNLSLAVVEVRSVTWVSLSENQEISRAAFLSRGSRGESVPGLFQLLEVPTFLGLWSLPPSSLPATVGHVLFM